MDLDLNPKAPLLYTLCVYVCVCVCTRLLYCILLFVTLWKIAGRAPLSMEFSRQEYRSGLPFPSPGDLPDLGIEPASPALSGGFFTTEPLRRAPAPNTHTHTHTHTLKKGKGERERVSSWNQKGHFLSPPT